MGKVKYSRRHFCTREKNIKKLKKNKLLKKTVIVKLKKKIKSQAVQKITRCENVPSCIIDTSRLTYSFFNSFR